MKPLSHKLTFRFISTTLNRTTLLVYPSNQSMHIFTIFFLILDLGGPSNFAIVCLTLWQSLCGSYWETHVDNRGRETVLSHQLMPITCTNPLVSQDIAVGTTSRFSSRQGPTRMEKGDHISIDERYRLRNNVYQIFWISRRRRSVFRRCWMGAIVGPYLYCRETSLAAVYPQTGDLFYTKNGELLGT